MAIDNAGQTPAPLAGIGQTPAPNAETNPKEETYTKEQLTDLISSEIGKVVKKHSKEKDSLLQEIANLKKASLPDPEKFKAELGDVTRERDTYKGQFEALNLKNKKREALEKANLNLPQGLTLTELAELMQGSEDDIPEKIAEYKKRWPARAGVGTATTTGATTIGPTIDDQIAEAERNGNWKQAILLRQEKYKM